ncbi:Glycosyl hydrolases family 16 [Microbulbifer donghaiensis]|uniref:Glycosyl hydrolases family 16 n=1 Tax=Microbulbifer donghaiensis TaxID=494016 RepID=A0A1M5CAZ3_9GAMM|nr:glycoside hydrolase family 16 protein [Microbulbifer donghaiensis]SHF51908.1 Glycosyl hydrolases family 16 [Microbulbifer donghaiensis]
MYKKLIALASAPLLCLPLASCGGKNGAAPSQHASPETPLSETSSAEENARILFDDFSYANLDELLANDWRVRTETGHPGVSGARWSADGITFLADSDREGNTLLRLTSSTDGSGENTNHTQLCHQRKYLEGTYAARVFFRDEPIQGPDGDQIIETFYTISPLKAPLDPDYSEMDFEYLANGGWGEKHNALFATSWETFKLDPFEMVNEHSVKPGSFAGWHTLVLQAANNKIRYFIDGVEFAKHSEQVFPEEPMSINFNLWFTQEGLTDSDELRIYQQDVDWVFHRAGEILDTDEVTRTVNDMRAQKLAFANTVPDWNPKLDSPCGL